MIKFARIVFAYFILCSAALAQIGQIPSWPPIQPVLATFQGPGDIVSGATIWGSCARVYQASLASTATSLCDLVDSAAPSVVICTLRGSATGFVDLAGTYCTGSVAPSAKCAAATGAVCNISKIYNQTGGVTGWSSTTAANQPQLLFSALNGLPGIQSASPRNFPSAAITQAAPISFSFVYERTGSFTTIGNVLSIGGGSILVGAAVAVNTAQLNALTATGVADSVFHASQNIENGASSVIYIDGITTSGNAGSTGLSANTLNLETSNGAGAGLVGVVMEVGMWPVAFTPTQYGNLNTNQHGSANGYNF